MNTMSLIVVEVMTLLLVIFMRLYPIVDDLRIIASTWYIKWDDMWIVNIVLLGRWFFYYVIS